MNFDLGFSDGESENDGEQAEQVPARDVNEKRFGDEDATEFIKSNQNFNTVRKTEGDVKLLKAFVSTKYPDKSHAAIETFEPEFMDRVLANFFVNCRKVDGTEYEPNSIRGFQASIQRYLKDNKYGVDIMKSELFATSRKSLDRKMVNLKSQGLGGKKNRARPLTDAEINSLFDKKVFDLNNPQGLLYLNYWNAVLHFGIRPGNECRNLNFSDIVLEEPANGPSFLSLKDERITKSRQGSDARKIRKSLPKAYSTSGDLEDPRDPVSAFKRYQSKRPPSAVDIFFLGVKQNAKPEASVWYYNSPMGRNKLGGIMKDICQQVGITDNTRKLSNHSIRKTQIRILKKNGVPDSDIALMTGHENINSINEYNELDDERFEEYSNQLSLAENTTTTKAVVQEPQGSNSKRGSSLAAQSSLPQMFCGATISGGTININLGMMAQNQNEKKSYKRIRICESSDSSQE